MKLNTLEKIRDVLKQPHPEHEITLDEELRVRAETSLRRMIEMTSD